MDDRRQILVEPADFQNNDYLRSLHISYRYNLLKFHHFVDWLSQSGISKSDYHQKILWGIPR